MNPKSWKSQFLGATMALSQLAILFGIIVSITNRYYDVPNVFFLIFPGILFVSMICQYFLYWRQEHWSPPGTGFTLVGCVLMGIGAVYANPETIYVCYGVLLVGLIRFSLAYAKKDKPIQFH